MNLRQLFARDPESKRAAAAKEAIAVVSDWDKFGGQGLPNRRDLFDAKTLTIVDKMMLDEAVGTYIGMKKAAALSVDWSVEPANEDDEKAVEHAESATAALENIEGSMSDSLHDMLSAIEYGYSATNVVWKIIESGDWAGQFGIKHLKTKPPHNIRFDVDDYYNILDDGVLFVDEEVGDVTRHRKDEFLIYTYRPQFYNPYGYSDCLRAYDRWNSKYWVNKFWDVYLERHANGTVLATYEADSNPPADEHTQVNRFLDNKQVRSALKVSDRWDIDVIETSGTSNTVFETAIAQRNTAIARALFLPDLLGFSEKPGGAYSLGKKHFDVFLWVLLRLHRDVAGVINGQLIRRLIDRNYGPQDAYPRFRFAPLTEEQKVNWLTNVLSGIEKGAITPDQEIENKIRRTLELAETERPDAPNPPATPPASENTASSFAASGAPKPNRALHDYEKKVDFEAIGEYMQRVEDDFVEIWSDRMRDNLAYITTYLRTRDIVTDANDKLVGELRLKNVPEQRAAMQNVLVSSTFFGALHAQKELMKAGVKEFAADTARFDADVVAMPMTELEKMFRDRGLVTNPAIKQAAAAAKRQAFFVTHVENEKILNESRRIIYNGIRRGDLNWTEGKLRKHFEKYLSTGELTENVLGTNHRVKTILRTNVTTAMNDGRRRGFEDPDVDSYVVGYQWSAVLDDSTTDYCRRMDRAGVLRKEEVNAQGWPPAHYNCRSVVVPVTEKEQFKYGKVPASAQRGADFAEDECCSSYVYAHDNCQVHD